VDAAGTPDTYIPTPELANEYPQTAKGSEKDWDTANDREAKRPALNRTDPHADKYDPPRAPTEAYPKTQE
jgi:hypothetical protein